MAATSRPLISLIVPVFNEQDNIEPFHAALLPVMDSLADRYQFELIFTDNHSTDRTFELLAGLARRDGRVRVFRFSRNFGYQRSILTGYLEARGAAAIQLDVDLQDPPEMIRDFLREWEAGHQVVYGVRRTRQEAMWMNLTRQAFYRLVRFLSEDSIPADAGDFRLIDRCVLDQLKGLQDCQPYLRGTIAAMGFSQRGLPYDRAGRSRGVSKFSPSALFGLALDGILNHSTIPLRLATYTGLAVWLCALLGIGAYACAHTLLGQQWPAGFTTTTLLILFSTGLNAMFLGIIGEYLGRIYKQVKRGPVTIVEHRIDCSLQPAGSDRRAA